MLDELTNQGIRCGCKRMARLMRGSALVGCHRRKVPRTTQREPWNPAPPDLVASPVPPRRAGPALVLGYYLYPDVGSCTSRGKTMLARQRFLPPEVIPLLPFLRKERSPPSFHRTTGSQVAQGIELGRSQPKSEARRVADGGPPVLGLFLLSDLHVSTRGHSLRHRC